MSRYVSKPDATHCASGHEMTPENTRQYPSLGDRVRICRACEKVYNTEKYQRMRAAQLRADKEGLA